MAGGVTVKFEQASLDKFQRLLDETVAVNDRDIRLQLRLCARSYIGKVIKKTPMMRKGKQRWVDVSAMDPKARAILVAKGVIGAGSKWAKAKDVGLPPWTIRGRGYARAGWLVALFGLGLKYSYQPEDLTKGEWSKVGEFRNALKAADPYVMMGNAVPFIETLNAQGGTGGETQFFQKAFDSLGREMEKRLNDSAKKTFRGWK